MSRPRIRRATVDDAAELASVYHSAYAENRELGFPAKSESVTPEEVAEWIDQHRVYVAAADDEIIGGVRLEVTDSDRMKLSRLGVHEDWKEQGVGSRLLAFAEAVVRDLGVGTVWLTAPEDHPYLPDVYHRRGYRETGPSPLEEHDYDEVVMEKRVG